jgi:hypothetical protein
MIPSATTSLLAFGFGNALILGWLVAAAAPVIIHLWNKRKYREVSWAAMEYLLAAVRKNARRIQLEQWLLLTVRTLIVALLVLAMAEPFLERAGFNFIAGTRTLKVFVVDGSYSMDFKSADQSRFERAKALVTQIVEDSPQGDGFTLVLMGSPPQIIVGKPAIEKREFFDELENLKLPHAGADLGAAVAKVEEIIRQSQGTSFERTEVLFFTDLQRTSWGPEQFATGTKAGVARLAENATLSVFDLGEGSTENLAITQLAVSEDYAIAGREITIAVQIRNFGTQPRLRHLLELYIDGRRVNDTLIDAQPGATVRTSFRHRMMTPGDHLVEARLGSDFLSLDNRRWLSIPVKEQLRTLVIDGKPAGDGVSGASDFVALALNPKADDPTARAAIHTEVAGESALVERELARYDAVYLCNVGQFTPTETQLLKSYVSNGGGLVIFLGDRVDADRYNRELGGAGLLPASLGKRASEAKYRFDPLNYRHPLVAPFKGREQAGLLSTPVYQYFQLTLNQLPTAHVALAFDGGDPAIVESPVGFGRVVLVASDGSLSSVDPLTGNPWTTMAAWPSFLPLVQEMLALVAGSQIDRLNVRVGDTIGELLHTLAPKATLSIHTPENRDEPLRLTTDDDGRRWSFSETQISGPYQVELKTDADASNEQTAVYAVNLDTRESNLARIDASELPVEFQATVPADADVEDATSAGAGGYSGLHRWLLYVVLILLFAEVFLAWRASHVRA